MNDETLARRLQQGDKTAINALAERHYDALLGYLYRLMDADRALAEDVLQETFLRVMRNIHLYTYPRPFKAWLYAIATNLARNHYKSGYVRLTQSIDEDIGAGESLDAELLAQEAAQEVAREVREVLACLPPQQREVIILAYYQAMSSQEIAEILDIPSGTVRSRLSIGIARVRALMKEKAE